MTNFSEFKNDIGQIKSNLIKPIVLVGMMGSGKSHVGRRLGEALGLRFRDSDKVVEHKFGCPISEIFATHGEEEFRKAERVVILELLSESPQVIATGGGAVMDPVTMKAIKTRTVSVWLRVGEDQLIARLKNSQDRPLLKSADPAQTIRDLLAERQPLYEQADITFDNDRGQVDDNLGILIKSLCKRLNPASF